MLTPAILKMLSQILLQSMNNVLCTTGRYMQLASAPRESSGQNERPSMAVQAAPAPAGDPLLVSRFLPTRE
jgi:hypothetical protein